MRASIHIDRLWIFTGLVLGCIEADVSHSTSLDINWKALFDIYPMHSVLLLWNCKYMCKFWRSFDDNPEILFSRCWRKYDIVVFKTFGATFWRNLAKFDKIAMDCNVFSLEAPPRDFVGTASLRSSASRIAQVPNRAAFHSAASRALSVAVMMGAVQASTSRFHRR